MKNESKKKRKPTPRKSKPNTKQSRKGKTVSEVLEFDSGYVAGYLDGWQGYVGWHYRIPDNEFSNDMEYQASMDRAWHAWCQPKYREIKKAWEEKLRLVKINSARNVASPAKSTQNTSFSTTEPGKI